MTKEEITVEQVQEFFDYLTGESVPDGIKVRKYRKLKPSHAFQIIWFLQEHLHVLPDHFERCYNCDRIFDTWSEGLYWESKYRHYCGGCMYQVPENYDRGKR